MTVALTGTPVIPGAEEATIEAAVEGGPKIAPRDCSHPVLGVDPTFGLPGDPPFDHFEVRIRVLCLACGCPFAVRLDSARAPTEGLGVVLVIDPEEGP